MCWCMLRKNINTYNFVAAARFLSLFRASVSPFFFLNLQLITLHHHNLVSRGESLLLLSVCLPFTLLFQFIFIVSRVSSLCLHSYVRKSSRQCLHVDYVQKKMHWCWCTNIKTAIRPDGREKFTGRELQFNFDFFLISFSWCLTSCFSFFFLSVLYRENERCMFFFLLCGGARNQIFE